MTINDLLDLIAEKHTETKTDYAIAKYMTNCHGTGWTRQRISHLRKGRDFPSDLKCLDIAEATGLDPLKVLATVHAEKAKDEKVKKAWKKAAASMACIVMFLEPTSAHASVGAVSAGLVSISPIIYIMRFKSLDSVAVTLSPTTALYTALRFFHRVQSGI